MSGDLLLLRMVVLSDDGRFGELCKAATRSASIPIQVTDAGLSAAKSMLTDAPPDIAVIDGTAAAAARDAAVHIARQCYPPPTVIVMTADAEDKIAGADVVLAKPRDLNKARFFIERCIWTKIPKRVLVVDDSGTMRSIVRKVLSTCGYALDVAETGQGAIAIEQLRHGSFDLIILDYNMPGLNGLETLIQIKKEWPHVGVAMMSTAIDLAVAEKAKAAGACGFLKKPFYPADIATVFDRYLAMQMTAEG